MSDTTNKVIKELIKGLKTHYDHQVKWHEEVMDKLRGGADNDFDTYQDKAYEYVAYENIQYPVMALAEEVGEVSALFAKASRKYGDISRVDRKVLMDELGDVLWNISALAEEFDISLSDIAAYNLGKLSARSRDGEIVER